MALYEGNSGSLSPSQAYDVLSGYGLEGTHMSGELVYNSSYLSFEAEIDLTNMKVLSAGKYTGINQCLVPTSPLAD